MEEILQNIEELVAHLDISETDGLNSAENNNTNWQSLITNDLRQHIRQYLVKSIVPADPCTLESKRLRDHLFSYAEHTENILFALATSRSEYYRMLAEKIFKIQKELKEKREKRQRFNNAEPVS